jgi:hypothetical protein
MQFFPAVGAVYDRAPPPQGFDLNDSVRGHRRRLESLARRGSIAGNAASAAHVLCLGSDTEILTWDFHPDTV